jgi:hypothetical protein
MDSYGLHERQQLLRHAAKALASNGYEDRFEQAMMVLARLNDDEIRLLFELAARVAAKDGPEGFRLPESEE